MGYEKARLGTLCSVKTGASMSRAKKAADSRNSTEARVLVSSAMESGRIVDEEIVTETISRVKDDLYTREGDVVLKTSTPYDCLYIDAGHAGLLVTSFAVILRPLQGAEIDMRYLAAYLNLSQTNENLKQSSKGATLQLLKKKDIEDFKVPIVPLGDQERIAKLYGNTLARKEECRKLMRLSDLVFESEFEHAVYYR